MLSIAGHFAYAQAQVVTTGNNVIDTANPLAADVVIGSDAFGGTRHDSSIMWSSSGSASRMWNSGDTFYLTVADRDGQFGNIDNLGTGASYMTVVTIGTVGIGTTNPQAKLNVEKFNELAAQLNELGKAHN